MLLYMIALRKMPTFIQEVKVLLKIEKGSPCYYGGDFRLIKLGNLYLYGVNWTSSTS